MTKRLTRSSGVHEQLDLCSEFFLSTVMRSQFNPQPSPADPVER